MNYLLEFEKRGKRKMAELDLTKYGITGATFSNWRREVNFPSSDNLAKIQEITGIPMPEQVRKLRDLPVRHTAVCDRDKMGQAVLDVMA